MKDALKGVSTGDIVNPYCSFFSFDEGISTTVLPVFVIFFLFGSSSNCKNSFVFLTLFSGINFVSSANFFMNCPFLIAASSRPDK